MRNDSGIPILILSKVVDYIICTGEEEALKSFLKKISARFKVGRQIEEDSFVFNILYIKRLEDGTIRFDMNEYMETITKIDLTTERRKEVDHGFMEDERRHLLQLTGSLNFLGHGVLPQAAFAASYLQQLVGVLKIKELITANKVLREVNQLEPVI